jgi:hypothetical protein
MQNFKIALIKVFLTAMVLPFIGCGGNDTPDVSALPTITQVKRFDKDFFAIDTLQLDNSLNKLNQEYPHFFASYLTSVLGVNPADPQAEEAIKAFIGSYKNISSVAQSVADKHISKVENQVKLGLQYMEYYFPNWKPDSPFVITTFIGPMDAFEAFSVGDYGDVRTGDGVGIALQLHLGANSPIYAEGRTQGVFYDYQIARFTPEMMSVNSMKNIIDDAFPYTAAGKTLLDEMIEKGKRLYLLDKLMPEIEDSLKIGYTSNQLKGCYDNEGVIWSFFVKNDLLYSKEASLNQLYIKDGPKTQELGESAPGYIGLFVGRQIVRSFMKKQPELPLEELMKKSATEIMTASGYKP